MRELRRYILIICLLCVSLCALGHERAKLGEPRTTKDSVLMYKIRALKAFVNEANYWGRDDESHWAYGKANEILNAVTDYGKYDEALAHIYAAKSYIFYGLSYVPSVYAESRRLQIGEVKSFPQIGLRELSEILIKDYPLLDENMLYVLSLLEVKALYSALYFFKASGVNVDGVLTDCYRGPAGYCESAYAEVPPAVAYRECLVLNMQSWFIYFVTCAEVSYRENYGLNVNPELDPWKEIYELAKWHDSLTQNISIYSTMPEAEFAKIELKAAYAQCMLLEHLAENLAQLKIKEAQLESKRR